LNGKRIKVRKREEKRKHVMAAGGKLGGKADLRKRY
jgi:hypothetical protein